MRNRCRLHTMVTIFTICRGSRQIDRISTQKIKFQKKMMVSSKSVWWMRPFSNEWTIEMNFIHLIHFLLAQFINTHNSCHWFSGSWKRAIYAHEWASSTDTDTDRIYTVYFFYLYTNAHAHTQTYMQTGMHMYNTAVKVLKPHKWQHFISIYNTVDSDKKK